MTKSNLRKTQTRTITTNKTVGWEDDLSASTTIESGGTIYVVPRKGEAHLTHVQMFAHQNEDPGSDRTNIYVLLPHGPENTSLNISTEQLIQRAFAVVNEAIRVVTAVGILLVGKELIDDLDVVISRQSNIQDDDDFSIVPVYRSSGATNLRTVGILYITEKLNQMIFNDGADGWEGYTYEESAS